MNHTQYRYWQEKNSLPTLDDKLGALPYAPARPSIFQLERVLATLDAAALKAVYADSPRSAEEIRARLLKAIAAARAAEDVLAEFRSEDDEDEPIDIRDVYAV